jgi:protein phosphatase
MEKEMQRVGMFGLTDIGMVREENEDSFWFHIYNDMAVAVVADGMGGHIGGKLSSKLAVSTAKALFQQNRGRLSGAELVEDCLLLGNRRIRDYSKVEFGGKSMGTTCTMFLVEPRPPVGLREAIRGRTPRSLPEEDYFVGDVKGDRDSAGGEDYHWTVYLGHVGDSRLYWIKGDGIVQKSKDHTVVQRLIDSQSLTLDQAEQYAHKNVLYRALGGVDDLNSGPIDQFPIKPGEILLLCSDGLSNYIQPAEMVRIVQGTKDLKRACQYLVALANSRGGQDNITVLLAEFGHYARNKAIVLEPLNTAKRKQPLPRDVVLKITRQDLIILLGVILTVLIGLLVYNLYLV